jgi:hypothetical protein
MDNTLARPIVQAYMTASLKVIPKYYKPDCCIAATKIAKLVFEKFRLKVRELPVKVVVANKAYIDTRERTGITPDEATLKEWTEKYGAYNLGIGCGPTGKPGGWDGHLVPLVNENFLLDIAIVQASRPWYNINPKPLAIDFSEFGKPPDINLVVEVDDCEISYHQNPENLRYRVAPDWKQPGKHVRAIGLIVDKMRYALDKR